jgi:hypothetical protein
MVTIFGDFDQFSAIKLAYFIILFLHTRLYFEPKSPFFGENRHKIITLVPAREKPGWLLSLLAGA